MKYKELNMGIKLRLFGISFIAGLSACASIEPASEAGLPSTYSYTDLEDSGLKARYPFPRPDDICVALYSNSLTKPFEVENHFLIACPKHEKEAIDDRRKQQKAKVIGNVKHWVVMRVPFAPKS